MTDYREARCRGVDDPEIFFPLGEKESGPEVDVAKAVCRLCPISELCLQDHIEVPFGVYGGTTPGERRAILRRMGVRDTKYYLNSRAMEVKA
jgi:hypothetical protein